MFRRSPTMLALGLLAVSVLFAPSAARAQDDEYHQVITEALAEFDAHNYAESFALFRRAHALRPSARTLRGLGMTSYELRHYVDTLTYLEESLASTVSPLTDEQRAQVNDLVGRASAFVGRYHVTADVEGALITVDGNEDDGEIVVDIGTHTLAVSASGYVTSSRTLNVGGGEDEALTVHLERATAVVEERVVVRADPGEPLRIAGWVTGAVGVVTLGVGLVAVGIREERIGNYNQSVMGGGCPALENGSVPAGANPDCYEFQNTWRTMDTLGYVFGIAGGGLLAVGIGVLIAGYLIPPGDPVATATADEHAPDVARGVELVLRDEGPSLSIGCGPFADLGVACSGAF